VCLQSDSTANYTFDSSTPPLGSLYFYLARAENACPGIGPIGTDSNGTPRTARTCP
jgi:hypothetical protein